MKTNDVSSATTRTAEAAPALEPTSQVSRPSRALVVRTSVKAGQVAEPGPGDGYQSQQDNEPALRAPASPRPEAREPARTSPGKRPSSALTVKTGVRAGGGGDDEGYESQQDNEPALRARASRR